MSYGAYPIDYDALEKLSLAPVATPHDCREVARLRFEGYRGVFKDPASTWDPLDDDDNSTVLVLRTEEGTALGTIRLRNSREGPIELDLYNKAYKQNFPYGTTFSEATRLVATGNEHYPKWTVQVALWWATMHYSIDFGLDQIIACARKGPDRGYKFLNCIHHEGCGYAHETLGNKPHEVYSLDVAMSESIYKEVKHPLYKFFFLEDHPRLRWY